MAGRFEHLIVRKPVNVTELPHHDLGTVVPFPVLMCQELVEEARAWALYTFVNGITPEMAAAVENDTVGKAVRHKHDYDEMYLMIGDEKALTFEVILGDEVYQIDTPGAVYIPQGVPHGIRPVKASVGKAGGLIPLCLNGEYITLDAD